MLLRVWQNCLFWRKQTAWAIKQHGKDKIGAWGEPPENKEWKFVQVGAQNWGYVAESSYTGQGDTTTSQTSCLPMIATESRNSVMISGNDNGAYFGDCDELKGREKRDCKDRYTSLKPKLLLTKPSCRIWRMGADCKTQRRIRKENYKDQKYIFPYNGKTTSPPKNYPLGGQ